MRNLQTQLADAIGTDNVSVDLPSGIADTAIADTQPDCIAYPTAGEDLSKVMALANENNWRVLPMGQGSKLIWGGLAEQLDLVVSTARLNKIVDHAVGDFTVTVQPGVKVADLQGALAKKGQFLAVDPAFSQRATVGGLVATADTGSLRQRYGSLRDMLIGVQFARYDGKLARAGGKVVKNVAGYDLMKLMTGSYGSLGVLSELTFRLYPQMSNLRSLILTGSVAAIEASAAKIRLSGLTPVAFDVLSASTMQSLHSGNNHGIVVRFQGVAEGVAEQSERLEKIAITHDMAVRQLDADAEAAFWEASTALIQPNSVLCKVGLKPSGIPALIELAERVMPTAQVRLCGSSGLGWVQMSGDVGKGVDTIGAMRSHCENNGGFLTLLQAPKAIKQKIDVWGYTGNATSVMASIKQKFDPNSLLSPGRFVGGL